MKRQWNERGETVRFVLQSSQRQKMLDALLVGLDVAVEHRGVGPQSDFVRRARDVEPLLPADLVVADDFSHARVKNLSAAASQRIDACFLERQQRVAN